MSTDHCPNCRGDAAVHEMYGMCPVYIVPALGGEWRNTIDWVRPCVACGAAVVQIREPDGKILRGCDCKPDCAHAHAEAIGDVSFVDWSK